MSPARGVAHKNGALVNVQEPTPFFGVRVARRLLPHPLYFGAEISGELAGLAARVRRHLAGPAFDPAVRDRQLHHLLALAAGQAVAR